VLRAAQVPTNEVAPVGLGKCVAELRLLRHSGEGRNPGTGSRVHRDDDADYSVIPAKAGTQAMDPDLYRDDDAD
jgi:hypothetical protein